MGKRDGYQSPTGTYMYDLADEKDYQTFVRIFGGEENLDKYPQISKAVAEKKGKRTQSVQKDSEVNVLKIEGSIAEIRTLGVENESRGGLKTSGRTAAENGQEESYNYYRLSTEVEISYANGDISDTFTAMSTQEEEESMTYCLQVKVKDNSTGLGIFQKKLYYEDESMRLLDEVRTDPIPYEKLAGRSFTMTVDVMCETSDGTLAAASLAPRQLVFNKATAKSYIHKITIKAPHWRNGKKSGNVVFFYGRGGGGDYGGGYYNQNVKGTDLRTIIPISGTIELNQLSHKVTGVSIDSYQCGGETYPKSYLDYNTFNGRKIIAEHGGNSIGLAELGKVLRENNDLTYDSSTNTVHFDLKLPVTGNMLGPYDWRCSLSHAFLDDSSHICYLTGCFVLRVEHEWWMGSDFDRYAIFIYSTGKSSGDPIVYYESGDGETDVFIPPIEICWGCFAKDTRIRIADGSIKPADQITVGDQIPAFGGKVLTVAEILTGEDAEIVCIETKDGRRIRVSDGHAMLVSDGEATEGRRMVAGRLQAGDRLMTPDGVVEISKVVTEPYHDMVYNFIFDGEEKPNYIEADGFWSGDTYAQNESKEKKRAQPTEEAIALRNELREFFRS